MKANLNKILTSIHHMQFMNKFKADKMRTYASVIGYSNTTSLPESFLYTAAKVSNLYSVLFRSLGSKKTYWRKTFQWLHWFFCLEKRWVPILQYSSLAWLTRNFISVLMVDRTQEVTSNVLWLQKLYLHDLGSINSVPNTLPNNLSRQYNILQHCLMHSRECTAARTLNSRTFLWWP